MKTRLAPLALVVVVAVAIGIGTACTPAAAPAASSSANALVLKAYDVPAEHAAELQGIVSGLLYTGKDQPRQGAASLAPSGQLLVSAPEGFHPGIAEVIQRLKTAPAQQAPTVTLDYWVVGAVPSATATKGADVSPEIADVLDALEKNQGPMKLELAERIKLSSQSGSEAQIDGSLMRASQTAALHGDKVVAEVKVRGTRMSGSVEARVEIPLGKTVVLGQAGTQFNGVRGIFSDEKLAEAADKGGLTAFYVVRASVDGKVDAK